jgi:hypothetical protein
MRSMIRYQRSNLEPVLKTFAGQQKTKFRGIDRAGWVFNFAAAAYDLVRLPKLLAEAA